MSADPHKLESPKYYTIAIYMSAEFAKTACMILVGYRAFKHVSNETADPGQLRLSCRAFEHVYNETVNRSRWAAVPLSISLMTLLTPACSCRAPIESRIRL